MHGIKILYTHANTPTPEMYSSIRIQTCVALGTFLLCIGYVVVDKTYISHDEEKYGTSKTETYISHDEEKYGTSKTETTCSLVVQNTYGTCHNGELIQICNYATPWKIDITSSDTWGEELVLAYHISSEKLQYCRYTGKLCKGSFKSQAVYQQECCKFNRELSNWFGESYEEDWAYEIEMRFSWEAFGRTFSNVVHTQQNLETKVAFKSLDEAQIYANTLEVRTSACYYDSNTMDAPDVRSVVWE